MDHFTPKKASPKKEKEDNAIFNTLNKLIIKDTNCPTKIPCITDFSIIKPISRGAFGKVFLGYKNNNEEKLLAIKVMRKSDMINKNMVSQVITERNALALSRSPFCVSLFYSLQTSSFIYLVMDYMVGGDLKSLLAMYGFFDESSARFYCAEIALALQYLHEHGIVHRDIKPDNMLVSITGHVKLTDFGLSKIELCRDLEISDLINCSPNLNTRTPGQLLSLTSHLSFGSGDKRISNTSEENGKNSNFVNVINKYKSSDSELETSISNNKHNDSKMSGVSPFFSAEDINVSIMTNGKPVNVDSLSSYYTCNSTLGSGKNSLQESNNNNNNNNANNNININNSKFNYNNEQFDVNNRDKENSGLFENLQRNKTKEDSGISIRKSDVSNNPSDDNMKDDYSSDFSKSYNASNINELSHSRIEYNSSMRNISRGFKLPESFRGIKRKRLLVGRGDFSDPDRSGSTGLTQEIDILDLGSSTPKKRKAKSPLKSVLKVRSSSDDEMPMNENLTNVMFSTPVSTQKVARRESGLNVKLKNTRFLLPLSSNDQSQLKFNISDRRSLQYIKMAEDPTMSPINNVACNERTPKATITPFRTPKSVRRGEIGSDDDRILGTPDYLAPELLLMHGHGPAVDWWALGVCLYEFLTGVPPFNDETPQKVFDNILSKNIEWPQDDEALSTEAVQAVETILTMDPLLRPTAKEFREIEFFKTIDWPNILTSSPPFIPTLENPTDTGYFEARNIMQHLKLSSFDVDAD